MSTERSTRHEPNQATPQAGACRRMPFAAGLFAANRLAIDTHMHCMLSLR